MSEAIFEQVEEQPKFVVDNDQKAEWCLTKIREAQAEIIKAYNNYRSAIDRLADYNTVIIRNARQVLDGKLYAYQRGETSLLEVINAQHTYNELQQAYAECLHSCMSAWVELERCAGTGQFGM